MARTIQGRYGVPGYVWRWWCANQTRAEWRGQTGYRQSDLSEDKKRGIFGKYATHENRWYALMVITLGLAIVVMDNTVLNVSIPYILRDLNTQFNSIQWAVSGYSLTIAAFLITFGRMSDRWGRKLTFLIGMAVFAIGSYVASIASGATLLIIGRALIQALGAAMVMTSALALLSAGYHGRERPIAFGIWSAVAGASGSIGPLVGGYLTTYYSWRWSLRINVLVAILALIGSVFIIESRSARKRYFDTRGTLLSAAGLVGLIYAFIEGRKLGWLHAVGQSTIFGFRWPYSLSIIPFLMATSIGILVLFALWEYKLEKRGGDPLLRPSFFSGRGFSLGIFLLLLLSFGEFGIFFAIPIYLEVALGYSALKAGFVFLYASVTIFLFGILSGLAAQKFRLKWIAASGLIVMTGGAYMLLGAATLTATIFSLGPPLIVFGIGFGFGESQLNNIVLSDAPKDLSGGASGACTTIRQLGASIGVAVLGAVLASTLTTGMIRNVKSDERIPAFLKPAIVKKLKQVDIEGGRINVSTQIPKLLRKAIKNDVAKAIVSATRHATRYALYFVGVTVLITFILPGKDKDPDDGS